MKICLRRSQTCCGGMYLCSDNTISFAKAKLHFRCLSPASIFLQTTSSNNTAPAEKTDETEIKAFFVWSMCQCLFLSTSSNVLAVFVPDRQIQQFSRGNFNSSAVNILLNNFALLQSLQYWRLKLEIFHKKREILEVLKVCSGLVPFPIWSWNWSGGRSPSVSWKVFENMFSTKMLS